MNSRNQTGKAKQFTMALLKNKVNFLNQSLLREELFFFFFLEVGIRVVLIIH